MASVHYISFIFFLIVVDSEEIGLRKVFTPMSTKGSVLISFQLFGTLVCFICSHFVCKFIHLLDLKGRLIQCIKINS